MRRLLTGRLRVPFIAAVSVFAGFALAALTIYPPQKVSASSTQVLIDMPSPSVVNRDLFPVGTLIRRAELLGQVMTSDPLIEDAGRRAGVPASEIGYDSRISANVPVDLTQPGAEERAAQLAHSGKHYSIEVQSRVNTPVLDVYTRAPTPEQAERLATAAVAALDAHLAKLADSQGIPVNDRLRLRPLGRPYGAVVSGGMPIAIGVLAFLIGAGMTCALLVSLARRPDRPKRKLGPAPPISDPWPHTSRLLPWMLAGFLAVLWLVPFNDIQLTVHLPIDLKFDRLLLPFVFVMWAIGMMVGGRLAPRWEITWIHRAVGIFVLLAFFSVFLDARHLNQTLELEGAVKQLPLLLAYVSLFVMISTGIRSNEVWPFMKYTLALAVICALGVIYEYRFKQNLFYNWSDKLLPGFFTVPHIDAGAVDNIGRRMVRGPAALPLETVAMLAMALPIALVSTMQAKDWRGRVLYGFAACMLLAAAFATYRKSALLAPLSVIATVAYFRRRELLRLAPLALVLVVVIHVAAPGALGKTTTQFDPSQLGVSTVSDRAADYDAVRPDVWAHLLVGRGWGTYDWLTYRILDSEFLHRTIEMGALGLMAYVAMMLSVVLCSRRLIAGRDRTWAPMALMGSAAAISFLTVSTLFDVLAFPHPTYIFLYMAGLTAIVVKQRPAPYDMPPDRYAPALATGPPAAQEYAAAAPLP